MRIRNVTHTHASHTRVTHVIDGHVRGKVLRLDGLGESRNFQFLRGVLTGPFPAENFRELPPEIISRVLTFASANFCKHPFARR